MDAEAVRSKSLVRALKFSQATSGRDLDSKDVKEIVTLALTFLQLSAFLSFRCGSVFLIFAIPGLLPLSGSLRYFLETIGGYCILRRQ